MKLEVEVDNEEEGLAGRGKEEAPAAVGHCLVASVYKQTHSPVFPPSSLAFQLVAVANRYHACTSFEISIGI